MWRFANCVYRAFRNSATYYYSHDAFVPLSTICSADYETRIQRENNQSLVKKCDIQKIFNNCEFTFENIKRIQQFLKTLSFKWLPRTSHNIQQIEGKRSEPIVQEVKSLNETEVPIARSAIEEDQSFQNTLQTLSDLHEETMSLVNLQLAVDALEAGDYQLGVETLKNCTKTKPNAAALYNLGICYERGLGVEKDRAKACDYYLQAASLGHINAQFNLTLLSNDIDTDESDHEIVEEMPDEKSRKVLLHERFFRLSLATTSNNDDDSSDSHQFDLNNRTVACLL